jgi:hypothetical protein
MSVVPRWRLALVMGPVLMGGCSELLPRSVVDGRAAACEQFMMRMDDLVSSTAVADAQNARIAGFPHLRINRFLASFAEERPVGERYAAWLERLRKLDADSRRIELRNLPSDAAQRLVDFLPGGMAAPTAIAECGRHLVQRDIQSAGRRTELLTRAQVPDSYYGWPRMTGLDVLARWPILEGVGRLQRDVRETFAQPLAALPIAGFLVRYPPPKGQTLDEAGVAAILAAASKNPLGIPEPDSAPLARLFDAFAPVFEVDTQTDADRVGEIRLQEDGRVRVDVSTPVAYRLVSHARLGKDRLLQLVYLIWMPARPSENPWDIYAGKFDGLIWRVTLAPNGRPIAYDSIHPCGCYYQVFPAKGFRVVQPEDGSEPVLSPAPLVGRGPEETLVIRLASRTHFIQRVYAESRTVTGTGYGWRNYDELRALEHPGVGRRSLFDEEGLVPCSERPERFLFWPMGVPSAGAMREWGTHAIAFIGRRHFDDPRLLETILKPLEPGRPP